MKSSRHAERERGTLESFFCCCSLLGYKVLIFENQMSEREKVNLRFVLLLTNGSCWGESSEGGKVNEGGRATFRRKWEETTCCFFLLLFFTSFGAESLLSLMCPNTTGKRQNRKRSEGKAVKRGFVRSEGIWCHGRSGTVTAGLDTSHRTKTGLNWQTHKFLSLLFSFNGHSLIRN